MVAEQAHLQAAAAAAVATAMRGDEDAGEAAQFGVMEGMPGSAGSYASSQFPFLENPVAPLLPSGRPRRAVCRQFMRDLEDSEDSDDSLAQGDEGSNYSGDEEAGSQNRKTRSGDQSGRKSGRGASSKGNKRRGSDASGSGCRADGKNRLRRSSRKPLVTLVDGPKRDLKPIPQMPTVNMLTANFVIKLYA
jgi:hypothetical protein